jgi:hypothetical protein
MSDLERDAEELGRRIWPDRRAVFAPEPRGGRGWWWAVLLVRRSRLAALAAGLIGLLAMGSVVFAATVTVRTLVHETQTSLSGGVSGSHGMTGPGSPATATGTAGPSGELAGGRAPGSGGSQATAGGVPGTPGPTATPPFSFPLGPSSTPSPSRTSVTITYQSSNGRTVVVSLGETIYIELSPTRLGLHWTMPHTANASVVEELSAAANGDGSAKGTFVAAGRGQTTLSAAESSCPSTDPYCPGPAMPWQVTIQVS